MCLTWEHVVQKQHNKPFRAKILVVDDQVANRDLLRQTLEPNGYEVMLVPSGEIALKVTPRACPDLILLDVVMPGGLDGYETCEKLKLEKATRDIPIIFITAKDETDSMVQGFRVGGVDYIIKPFAKEEVLVRVDTHLKNALLTQELLQKNDALQAEIDRREQAEKGREQAEAALREADERLSYISTQEAERWGIAGFVGESDVFTQLVDNIRRLQEVDNTSVLIAGESGTGKELIARAIHFGGARKKGPFIPVNCAAIPAELLESMFFGHKKGAFTGASEDRKGYFAMADGGTLFLDEIGDMPKDLQVKLLRVLEDGRFMPVGETHEKEAHVRVLAATNADLKTQMADGTFREDLYYRLASFTVQVPPLREHKEDIPLLANHFLDLLAKEMGKEYAVIGDDALDALALYDFPGNIRELRNIIEHALILCQGDVIFAEHLALVPGVNQQVLSDGQSHIEDRNYQEDLLLKRAQVDEPLESDEQKILDYLKSHTTINNAECRELLDVNRSRALYLLQKLARYNLVVSEGQRRWLRYRLA